MKNSLKRVGLMIIKTYCIYLYLFCTRKNQITYKHNKTFLIARLYINWYVYVK